MSQFRRTSNYLLAAVVISLPVELGIRLTESHPGTLDPYLRWTMAIVPLDLVWVAFTVSAAASIAARRTWPPLNPSTAISAVLLVGLGLAWVVNPSPLGLSIVLRTVGAVLVIAHTLDLTGSEFRCFIALPLLVSGTSQACLALFQVLQPGGYGTAYGGWYRSQGTFYHPYVLGAFLVLTIAVAVAALPTDRWRALWLGAIGLCAAAIPTVFGRSAAIALLLVIACLIWGAFRSPRTALATLAAVTLPTIVSFAVLWSGWAATFDRSLTSDLNAASSGRLEQVLDASAIVAGAPYTGVGPGRYLNELASIRPELVGEFGFLTVHSVPMAVAAEGGLLLGLVFSAAMVALLVRAIRTGPIALTVYVSLAPFILLDKFTYTNPNGLMMLSIWMATVDRLWMLRSEPDPDRRGISDQGGMDQALVTTERAPLPRGIE